MSRQTHHPGAFRLRLCIGDREARADCQRGELINRIAAGAPVRKLLFVEVLGHTRVTFAGYRPDHRTGIELAAIDAHRAAETAADLERRFDDGVARQARAGPGSKYVTLRGGLRRAIPLLLVWSGARGSALYGGTARPACVLRAKRGSPPARAPAHLLDLDRMERQSFLGRCARRLLGRGDSDPNRRDDQTRIAGNEPR
jgi:hypothetical protein